MENTTLDSVDLTSVALDADRMVAVAHRLRHLAGALEPPEPARCPYTGSSTAITAYAMAVMAKRVKRIIAGMEQVSTDLIATCQDHAATDEQVCSRLRTIELTALEPALEPARFGGGRR